MSKYNLEKALRRELEILNEQIDRKIMRGVSYSAESKRHKYVLMSLANLRRSQVSNWFGRSFASII